MFRKLSFLNDLILLQTLIVFEIMRMSYVKWITRCITSSVATEFRVTTAEKSFMLFIYILHTCRRLRLERGCFNPTTICVFACENGIYMSYTYMIITYNINILLYAAYAVVWQGFPNYDPKVTQGPRTFFEWSLS